MFYQVNIQLWPLPAMIISFSVPRIFRLALNKVCQKRCQTLDRVPNNSVTPQFLDKISLCYFQVCTSHLSIVFILLLALTNVKYHRRSYVKMLIVANSLGYFSCSIRVIHFPFKKKDSKHSVKHRIQALSPCLLLKPIKFKILPRLKSILTFCCTQKCSINV